MDRPARLNEIANEIRKLDESPLYEYRQEHGFSPVPGEGNAEAKIMFIGEALGKKEAETGRPLVGAAGRVLDELLASIGLSRDKVFITNIVKDRPPENCDPRVAEIEAYAPFLRRQIDVIRPRIIATLGRFAMDFVLSEFDCEERGQKISDLHGSVIEAQASYGPVIILPLYHPAAALYNPDLRDTLKEDFAILERYVE